jgi:hypothetical protein
VPKEHTVFRIEIPVNEADEVALGDSVPANLVFELLGSQFLTRPAERGVKKLKFHLPDGI